MPSSIESDLEDVFMFLSMAQDLEETNRIEAATKVREYAMKHESDACCPSHIRLSLAVLRSSLFDEALCGPYPYG